VHPYNLPNKVILNFPGGANGIAELFQAALDRGGDSSDYRFRMNRLEAELLKK